MEKITGKDGKFAFITEGTELDYESAEFAGGFCRISAVGAASAFTAMKDAGVEGGEVVGVEDVIYLDSWALVDNNPLSEGDKVIPFTIDVDGAAWVTDTGRSASRDTNDNTSQGDVLEGKRSLELSPMQNESGSVSGFYDVASSMQREIDSRFTTRIVHDAAGKVTKVPIKSDQFITALYYRESTVSGEKEFIVFRKMIIPSIDDAGKPMNGNVPFNFSYNVTWKRQYERVIPAA